MKIAIISDSHDNIVNIQKALDYFKKQKIEAIIHCGDICAPSLIPEIFAKFNGKIFLVCGNVGDPITLKEFCEKEKNIKYFDEFGEIEIDNKNIAFCHKPVLANNLAETGKYDIVFYGHTHKPWVEKLSAISNQLSAKMESKSKKLKAIELVNPGTLAGLFYKATFAIFNTKTNNLELKLVEKI